MSMICSLQCIAQGERNNWCFGDSVGVTFNTGSPTLLSNIIARSYEPAAAISTKNGTLLFYGTSYFTGAGLAIAQFYNAAHTTMLNSLGINTNASTTQGQIILPNPADSNSYYLFSLARQQNIGDYLYYNTIDLLLDSGRGAVVQKNVLLCDTALCEKMTAVKHANGRDWWLLVHQPLSNIFFEYLVTPIGISGPTVLSVGSCISCNGAYDQGQMVFSKDGSKLCVANGFGILDLYDFDRCSGTLTLNQNLGVPYSGLFGWTTFYGCSFSEDGQVLYASRFDTLWQYDLNAGNIVASRLYLMSVNNAEYAIGQHLIGPDNKIYISTARNNGSTDSLDYKLSVINYPDSVGLACDLRPHSISLGGHRARGGLPNLPHYELGALTGSVCDTLTALPPQPINANTLQVYPNPATNSITFIGDINYIKTVTKVEAINPLGQKQELRFEQKDGFTCNVTGLSNGLYYLRLMGSSTKNCLLQIIK